MEKTLIDYLKEVEDYRGTRGRRYPLWMLLLLVILGSMSGCQGYRAIEDFAYRHYAEVCERLGIVPKYYVIVVRRRGTRAGEAFDQTSYYLSSLSAGAMALATNWSMVRNFVINLFRRQGYHSLTQAMRLKAHDLGALFALLNMN